jgi:hypothetical protein
MQTAVEPIQLGGIVMREQYMHVRIVIAVHVMLSAHGVSGTVLIIERAICQAL